MRRVMCTSGMCGGGFGWRGGGGGRRRRRACRGTSRRGRQLGSASAGCRGSRRCGSSTRSFLQPAVRDGEGDGERPVGVPAGVLPTPRAGGHVLPPALELDVDDADRTSPPTRRIRRRTRRGRASCAGHRVARRAQPVPLRPAPPAGARERHRGGVLLGREHAEVAVPDAQGGLDQAVTVSGGAHRARGSATGRCLLPQPRSSAMNGGGTTAPVVSRVVTVRAGWSAR